MICKAVYVASNLSEFQRVSPSLTVKIRMGNRLNSTGIPKTILPLDKLVKVHLVPKFLTSDGTKFDSRYSMTVKVTALGSAIDKYNTQELTANGFTQQLTANVEFHQRRFNLTEKGSLRTRSVNYKYNDIEVKQVAVIKDESIIISGIFTSKLMDANKEAFELILCPSKLMNTDGEGWLLMGTLYTRDSDSKREYRWRAAVRTSLD